MDADRAQSESRQTAKASQEQRELLRVTLSSIGDAVITTDKEIRITFLNPVAETLTGWMQEEAIGVPLERVFKIVNEETRRTVENPATRALREGVVVGLANHTLLIAKDGTEHPIDDSAAPIRHANGEVAGVVLVFNLYRKVWELPGGLIDAGETPCDAARRELFEEAGCRARDLHWLGLVEVSDGSTHFGAVFRGEVGTVPMAVSTDEIGGIGVWRDGASPQPLGATDQALLHRFGGSLAQ